jgi:hypothetical protein
MGYGSGLGPVADLVNIVISLQKIDKRRGTPGVATGLLALKKRSAVCS